MRAPPNAAEARRFALGLARATAFVWRTSPAMSAAGAALMLVQSVLTLGALYLLKQIVDAIAGGAGVATVGAATPPVLALVAIACAVAILIAGASALENYVSDAHAQRVSDRMQDELHAKSIEVDLAYYESPQYYDTLHRAQEEAPYRPTRIARGLLSAAQATVSLAAMAALLLSFHWAIALVLFVAVVPEALIYLKAAGDFYAWRRASTPRERHAQYYNLMMTGSGHAQEVRLFGLGRFFVQQYRDLRAGLRRERLVLMGRRARLEFAAQGAAGLALFAAYAFVAMRALEGAITLGDLAMVFGGLQRGRDFLRQLLRAVAGLYEDSLFLTNLYEFLDLERGVVEPARPAAVPRPMARGIAFENVTFSYGGKEVLRDVNLEIPAGATVALVGENGSGKTTLIKLLARLYDPCAGRITFDGIDLREFATTALRRELSVIFQDYVRYNLTARENIWFGNVESAADPDRLRKVAEFAGADTLIRKLPHGFDTVLGRWFDEGEELSVGEWQKIALARALLREAQVIVLDEPTSAMDAAAEYEMFSRFRDVAAGRTAILISHRLSTVKMADRIFVLHGGRVVESGTHDDLLREAGAYAHLYTAQAGGYR